MSYFTPEYVTTLLINKDDLVSYSRRVDEGDPISAHLDATQDLGIILQAFSELSEKNQNRINIYLFSGLTQMEMAKELKTKQPNIKRNFLRSIEKLISVISE